MKANSFCKQLRVFLGTRVGRALLGCGSLWPPGIIVSKLSWVSPRPVAHDLPFVLLIPQSEEKPRLFSLSLHSIPFFL